MLVISVPTCSFNVSRKLITIYKFMKNQSFLFELYSSLEVSGDAGKHQLLDSSFICTQVLLVIYLVLRVMSKRISYVKLFFWTLSII
jgi:hypothetical protein